MMRARVAILVLGLQPGDKVKTLPFLCGMALVYG